MAYVVKLGTVSAQRNYTLKQQGSGIAWKRGPAQPFAAKVNTANQYDQVDTWNEWVQEDWQTGVGRVDPTSGGFLYGEAETRVPNQVILPPLLQQCDQRTIAGVKADCRYMPANMAGTHTLGDSGDYDRMAVSFTLPNPTNFGSGTAFTMAVYAQIPVGVSVTIAIFSNSAGAPNASVVSTTMTGTAPDQLFQWYGAAVSNASLVAGTQYWLVIYPTTSTNTITVAYGTSGYDTDMQAYNNAAWAALTGKYMLYTTEAFRIPNNLKDNSFYFRFNSVLYHTAEGYLYKYDSANEQFDGATTPTITGSGNITSVAIFGPTVFFARDSGNYTTMNTSEAYTAAATTASLFLEWKGYLWRAYQNDVYYSTDGSTWSSAIQIGGDDSNIRGMAGMGDSLYLATDKALFRLAPGNIVEESTRFGTEDSTNGLGMLEYQGRLYIPAGGRLFRFDPSGQMQDIWVSREDDLVTNRIGKISSLGRMNNWLVAAVVPVTAGGRPTIWVWQEEGWHFLVSFVSLETVLIPNTEMHSVYYDRGTGRLWFSYTGAYSLFVDISDYTLNPFNDSGSLYMPRGWLEQDRFYGGQYLLDKDFESVTIVGDNLSTNVNAKVYWQDEGSTGWELLGIATSDGQELRWGDHSTRPQGKWIKLGILLQTNDGDETPRVRAIVVKFLPMVNDRIRDTVTITLKNYIQLPDGTPDSYTATQQLAHIESMVESVIPIIYTDPLGVSYEAKVVDYSMGIDIFAHENSANVIKEVEATLVIEQVPDVSLSGQPSGMLLALTRS
jgi:hypothetical protein